LLLGTALMNRKFGMVKPSMNRSGTNKPGTDMIVRSLNQHATRGWLTIGWQRFPCALGRNGRHYRKVEGDGRTPVGIWRLRTVYYRVDHAQSQPRSITPPRIGQSGLSRRMIRREDGWCDAQGDRNYNRAVTRPYAASSEALWRNDDLYDLVIVLNHNERPRIQGGGSAIFIHIARPGLTPTEGCVALQIDHLRRVLQTLRPTSRLRVTA
jgi:L,D-peptidoglycan transpeptidase YkuD (ErfK/YbiS/YcfS/YnhG family)